MPGEEDIHLILCYQPFDLYRGRIPLWPCPSHCPSSSCCCAGVNPDLSVSLLFSHTFTSVSLGADRLHSSHCHSHCLLTQLLFMFVLAFTVSRLLLPKKPLTLSLSSVGFHMHAKVSKSACISSKPLFTPADTD